MKEIYGVIGSPIAHSLSPLMHNAAFAHLKIDAHYYPFMLTPDELEAGIKGMRALKIAGLNVTIPHKVNVMRYLDEIDPFAMKLGAVNTIVYENGVLKGYNTDGEGYYQSLLPLIETDLSAFRVLIIGAGGAAKGVALTLAAKGIKKIVISNRTPLKAVQLAEACSAFCSSEYVSDHLTDILLDEFDLIINTTSIGMHPQIDSTPLALTKLKKGAIVSDLIYTPKETRFLKEAKKLGAKTLNGFGMFIEQGALSFEYWTNHKAPREIMARVVQEKLERK